MTAMLMGVTSHGIAIKRNGRATWTSLLLRKESLDKMFGLLSIIAVSVATIWLAPGSTDNGSIHALRQNRTQESKTNKDMWLGEILNDEALRYHGYVLKQRQRRIRDNHTSALIDVSYAVLERHGKLVATFDDNIYFGMGNNTRFGLFSLLGGPGKQAVISQDVFRGGTQWVINLSPQYRIIFNGPAWKVGREGDDMEIIELDHDGIYEIAVPITDFYDFQDKLPIGQIPLPQIIFKYDTRTMKYVPANPIFTSYFSETRSHRDPTSVDDFEQRSAVLERLLTYIYEGKQKLAWDFYDKTYKLSDKEEIRRRVKVILNKQPVYKFIYKSGRYK